MMTDNWGGNFQFILLVRLWTALKKCFKDAIWKWDFVCKVFWTPKKRFIHIKYFLYLYLGPSSMLWIHLNYIGSTMLSLMTFSQTQSSFYFPSLMPISSNTQFIKMEWFEIFPTTHLNRLTFILWLDKYKLWLIQLRNGEILPLTFVGTQVPGFFQL